MKYRMLSWSLCLVLSSSLVLWATAQDLELGPAAYRVDDDTSRVISLADDAMAIACNGTTLVAWIGELEVSGENVRRVVGRWIGHAGPAGPPFSIMDATFDRDARVIPPRVFFLGSVFRVAWAQEGTLYWRDYEVGTLAPSTPVRVDLPPGQLGRNLQSGPAGEMGAMWWDEVSSQLTAQVFATDGTPIEPSFPVAVGGAGGLYSLGADQWLAFWAEGGHFADHITQVVYSYWTIKSQRFDTAGTVQAGESILFSGRRDLLPLLQGYENRGTFVAPLVGGEFVVIHGRYGANSYIGPDVGSVVAKTVDTSDVASAEIEVREPLNYATMTPRVASEPSGDFLVVWNSSYDNFSARHYAADGGVSAPLLVPAEISSHRGGVGTAALDSAGQSAGVLWIERAAPPLAPTDGLFFRRLQFDTLLSDDFESGSLVNWCETSASP